MLTVLAKRSRSLYSIAGGVLTSVLLVTAFTNRLLNWRQYRTAVSMARTRDPRKARNTTRPQYGRCDIGALGHALGTSVLQNMPRSKVRDLQNAAQSPDSGMPRELPGFQAQDSERLVLLGCFLCHNYSGVPARPQASASSEAKFSKVQEFPVFSTVRVAVSIASTSSPFSVSKCRIQPPPAQDCPDDDLRFQSPEATNRHALKACVLASLLTSSCDKNPVLNGVEILRVH